jgi:uncharacterized protein YdaU (DUF1376 family)
MRWFSHYIDDYDRKTCDLSFEQDGAYRRLLDRYYATGVPLPLNLEATYRMVRASVASERKAVQYILGRFWVKTDSGWVNKRAEEELVKAACKSEERANAARARWKRDANADANAPPNEDANAHANAKHKSQSQSDAPSEQESTSLRSVDSCAEPQVASAPAGPEPGMVVMMIPTNKPGQEYPVSQAFADEMAKTYPATNVPDSLQRMRAWTLANPTQAKTSRGMKRFINAWLAKEQDRPRSKANGGFFPQIDLDKL